MTHCGTVQTMYNMNLPVVSKDI